MLLINKNINNDLFKNNGAIKKYNNIFEEKCAFLSSIFFNMNTNDKLYKKSIGLNHYYNYFYFNSKLVDKIYNIIINKEYDKMYSMLIDLINKYKILKFNDYLNNIFIYKINKAYELRYMNTFSLNLLNELISDVKKLNNRKIDFGNNYTKKLDHEKYYFSYEKNIPYVKYPIIIKNIKYKKIIYENLYKNKLEAGNFNWPYTLSKYINSNEKDTTTNYISKNIINLPNYPYLTIKMVDHIIDVLNM
jgi:hypothetical protein